MIYSLLRSASAVALRWYYADVTIVGRERVPATGPLLVAVNHPNALVDVLVAGRAVSRRLMFTAKATLFSNPLAAAFLKSLGVIPLRRASDEGGTASRTRNAEAFDAVADALARQAAVLIFPEGKSHDEPSIAPLRSGAARMALHAMNTRDARGIRVLPIGLIFERKDRPRSRILAIVGDPIEVDAFVGDGQDAVALLTAEIDRRLRTLTLNYATSEEASRDARLSQVLSSLVRFAAPEVGDTGDLRLRADVARLLPSLRSALFEGDGAQKARAAGFESDVERFDSTLRSHRISLDDMTISRELAPGAWFVARETLVFALAAPIAAWGWINHLIPFNAALAAGGRVKRSAVDPAMYTIVAGAAFVLMMYMLQGVIVTLVAGPWWGLGYVLSLPIAADINLRTRDRLSRALRRARAYLVFRRNPTLHDSIVAEARRLRSEALSLASSSGLVALD